MARPEKEIDYAQFEVLCSIQCTQEEICSVLDVSDKTLNKLLVEKYNMGYSDVYKKYADTGKMSLRRKQMQVALGGNVSMLIWLGKQVLDQKDKREQKVQFDADINYTAKFQEHADAITERFRIPLS